MYASVRVEGKVLEVSGGVGGLFPFKVAEASRRKRSFIRLSFQEFRWLAVQMVRLCFSRREMVENFQVGSEVLVASTEKE